MCGRQFPVPRVGEEVLDTELGRHLFHEHPEAIEMAASLITLFERQGVVKE
jgi:hypothetical protein